MNSYPPARDPSDSHTIVPRLSSLLACLLTCVLAVEPWPGAANAWARQAETRVEKGKPAADNIGHDHHHHTTNAAHPRTRDAARFLTDRTGRPLDLPVDEDAFVFAVFGERTGGPAADVSILAEAVRDVNLLEPDLVMTVGDLVEGYSLEGRWMAQMREYRSIMDRLLCPWFPVAGNHDVYPHSIGGVRMPGGFDQLYEVHFGPLWYAFEHKGCWFIVLYSDEGHPETKVKDFRKPEAQRVSPEQFQWLSQTLTQTSKAQHVFVFLHHPRWMKGNYGNDWDRVHELLAKAGNVRAVFAGHIHRMQYDGPHDGIEYVTLATTGGGQSGKVPSAGYLHHFHLVTVRETQIALAAVPVGEFINVREINRDLLDDVNKLVDLAFLPEGSIVIDERGIAENGTVESEIVVATSNPTDRPIEITLVPSSQDSRWTIRPDHAHRTLPPGESWRKRFQFRYTMASFDESMRPPRLDLNVDYLAPTARYPLPSRRLELPLDAKLIAPTAGLPNRVLRLNGRDEAVRVPSPAVELPDEPLTLECRFRAKRFGNRVGLITKTEMSEYGFFVSDAVPTFSVMIGNRYVTVVGKTDLETNRWYHAAGVYDGTHVRMYLDGKLVASLEAAGARRRNQLPLVIGGDVNAQGAAVSLFEGDIDDVRLSRTPRYHSDQFDPPTAHTPDSETVLLLDMNYSRGPFLYNAAPNGQHPILDGSLEP